MLPRKVRQSFRTAAWAVLIFGVNAILCAPLFRTEYLTEMFSIEAAYIGLTRWISQNWGDLSWFPLWNDGEPLQNTYQPGLPLLSALTGKLLHVDAALAYHVTIAAIYCLGPVGLFLLVYRLSARRETAILAALLFSFISPSAFLVPVIRHDMGSVWHLRRYYALVFYGEGPNVCGLSLTPFGLVMIDAVYRQFTAVRFLGAAVIIGAIVLISWPASVVLVFGVLAYLLSREWAGGFPQIREKIFHLIALAAAAYALIAPLDLPSTILANQRNSQMIGGDYRYTWKHAVCLALIVAALALSRVLLERFRTDRLVQFSFYWSLIPGAVALSAFWAGFALLPQPERFHLGMEIGMVALGAVGLVRLLTLRPQLRLVGIAAVFVLIVIQTRSERRFVRRITSSIDITQTFEYQIAQWLDRNLHGKRVFATGSAAFWMNTWTDQPQATGCCLPGQPNPMSWIVSWAVPSGFAAGVHDTEYSLLWMRAWGAQAVLVGGERTRNAYHDWPHPLKFEGALPKLWESGEDRLYRIPSRTDSLAHVIEPGEVVARAPIHGLDVDPLRPFVHALEDPARPLATWTWLNRHEATVEADLKPGELISVQETMLPGWRASSAGHPIRIEKDALGLIILHPPTPGPMRIDLVYDGGTEAKVFQLVSAMCWTGLLAWTIIELVRKRRPIRFLY